MSVITSRQVQIVQIARRQVEQLSGGAFDESSYQLALCNAGVTADATGRFSSKLLTQRGFEKLMAVFESMGFRNMASGLEDYWQTRNAARTGFATSRQVFEITRLAPLQRYPLSAMCRRASNDQHDLPEHLTMQQARKLIEGLKASVGRESYLSKESAVRAN